MNRAVGIIIILVGIFIPIIVIAGSGGAGGTQGDMVCDLVGSVSGKVHDDNVFKGITVYSLSLTTTNCHERGIFEFNIGQPGALITSGEVEITVRAMNDEGEMEDDVKFVVTTAQFQVEKDFNQNIKLKTLVQGDIYTIQVFAAAWEGGAIKHTQQVTV